MDLNNIHTGKNISLNGHTILIGLMADPIRHSMSPTMHNNAFAKLGLNYAYLCFEIDNQKLPKAIDAIRTLDMRGSNISMPNKQKVIPYLDRLDESAELCQAVNTIVNDHGILTGYTTDGIGFMQSLKDEGLDITGQKMVLTGPERRLPCRQLLRELKKSPYSTLMTTNGKMPFAMLRSLTKKRVRMPRCIISKTRPT